MGQKVYAKGAQDVPRKEVLVRVGRYEDFLLLAGRAAKGLHTGVRHAGACLIGSFLAAVCSVDRGRWG